MKHGIQQTLEIFSGGEHKITKRKLKSWLESQNKIKGGKPLKNHTKCSHITSQGKKK